MSKPKDETRAAIVGHVMTAGHVPGEIDKTELLRAANLVAGEMARSDGDEAPAKMTPATASRLLNAVAGLSEHAGLTERDDENVKQVVAEPKPPESKDDSKAKKDEGEDKEPTLADVVKLLGGFDERLGKLEKRGDKAEKTEGDGDLPESLAADSAYKARSALERADASEMSFRTEHLFYDWQSRVDAVAGLYGIGHHAPKPMAGEKLRAYKVRCLREWQNLSKAFKDVDLKVLSIADGAAFAVACDDILKAADSEARHPTQVPDGWLTERVEQTRAGHTVTKFYGRPKAWMGQFMPRGAVVKNVRQVASDGRIEGTLYQRG